MSNGEREAMDWTKASVAGFPPCESMLTHNHMPLLNRCQVFVTDGAAQ